MYLDEYNWKGKIYFHTIDENHNPNIDLWNQTMYKYQLLATQKNQLLKQTLIYQCIQHNTIIIERDFGETTFNELFQENECFKNACMQILAIKQTPQNKNSKWIIVDGIWKKTQPKQQNQTFQIRLLIQRGNQPSRFQPLGPSIAAQPLRVRRQSNRLLLQCSPKKDRQQMHNRFRNGMLRISPRNHQKKHDQIPRRILVQNGST